MKYKTALKQSQSSVKFLALAILGLSALAWKYPGKATLIPLAFLAAYFAMDAYNIHRIRKRAAEDPGFLDREVK